MLIFGKLIQLCKVKKKCIGAQLLYSVVLVSTVPRNEPAVCAHVSPPFGASFPSRSPRSAKQSGCAVSSIYTQYQQCMHVSPDLPIPLTYPCPPWYPYVFSLHLYLYFCFVHKIIYTISLDSTYMCSHTTFVFLFLTYFIPSDSL